MDKKYISCFISGTISTIIFHPVDALRTILFFEHKIPTVRLLYNGFTFNWYTSVIKQCCCYPVQECIKSKLTTMSEIKRETVSGLITGLTLSLVATPVNTIKIPPVGGLS